MGLMLPLSCQRSSAGRMTNTGKRMKAAMKDACPNTGFRFSPGRITIDDMDIVSRIAMYGSILRRVEAFRYRLDRINRSERC